MPGLQKRNGSWRVIFRFQGKQHSMWIGEVPEKEAETVSGRVDYWLMRFKQNLVELPPGCDIVSFLEHDGKPPVYVASVNKDLTLAKLREVYVDSQQRKLEQTTLDGMALHFNHLVRIIGPDKLIPTVTRADLQAYVDRRSGEWIDPNVFRRKRREKLAAKPPRKNRKPAPPAAADKPRRHPSPATIKKEIVSLRTAWNWARRQLNLAESFPGVKLDFAKVEEALPFMSWEEAEARIAAGDDPERIWDCVYLKHNEVAELLAWVQTRQVSPWVYPMFVFAGHTGARRSEIVRALPSDVDLKGGVVTIREKKRDKNRYTTRRVPMTPLLKDVLAKWMLRREKGKPLFCKDNGQEITPREAFNYVRRALRTSKWKVLKGLHVFRHSFISALASRGVDQRIIDDLVGHCTEQQRRRYRHLYPDVKQEAVLAVFG
jgi:integrase